MGKRFGAVLCVAVLGLSLIGCGGVNNEEAQRQASFVDAVEAGIADWSDVSSKRAGSIDEQISLLQQGIDVQIDAASKFKSEDFGDESFADLVKDYKSALDMESAGLVNYPNDPATYNDTYVKGCKKAASVVKELEDKAGLEMDDDHSKALSKYVKSPSELVPLGQTISFETEAGGMELSVDSFVVDAGSSQRAREFDGWSENQNYSYLLCTVTNDSIDPKTTDGISFGDLIQTKGPDGIDLTCPNFSYEWPGYEIATGGYLGTMSEGSTKKVAVPYLTDASVTDYCVVVGNVLRFVKAQ